MSDQSPRLGLPYVRAGQLQKHVTVNEGLTRLDALVQTAIASRTLSAPPQVIDEGAIYLVGANPTGAWAAFSAGQMLMADMQGWRSITPSEGMMAVILDEGVAVIRRQGQWQSLAQMLGSTLSLDMLGVGASPDSGNPFSARLNKALWAARPTNDGGDGDLRFTFNKQAASHTASLLFQSGWQGRAEFGLTGDDDLRLKVSGNGNSWNDAFSVDRSSGRVWFSAGATRRESTTFSANGTLNIPAWVRWVEAVAVAGGGGGAAGTFGAAGTLRKGGGGGGAGGVSMAIWPREHLGPNLAIAVGGGGSGGNAANGGVGGNATISTYGNVILRATGGAGGQTSGAAGLGGLGEGAANAGGVCSELAVASIGESQTCPFGSGGGGAGGGLTTANAAQNGAAGGAGGISRVQALGGNGSAAAGGVGSAPSLPNLSQFGGGGAGGAARASGVGFAGGAGGNYGAGGGGGGAGTTAGGVGGSGAGGIVVITMVG